VWEGRISEKKRLAITLGSSCPFHAHRGPLDLSSITLKLPQGRLMIQIFHTFLNPFFLSKKQQKKRAPNFHSIPHFLMAILPPPKRTTSAQTTNTQLLTLGEIKEKSSNCYTNLCTNFVEIVCVHKYCCKWGVHVCVCLCVPADRQILFNNNKR
jgi:hypothetical protein